MTRDIRAPLAGGGIDALSRASEDGIAAARAEVEAEMARAYAQGRRDFVTIIRSEAARGREVAAIAIAGDVSLSPAQAIAKLATMPRDAVGATVPRQAPAAAPAGHDALVRQHLARLIPTRD